jgi:phage terminase large subunit-like protein
LTDWVAIGRQYARDIIGNTIPACRWIKLACERSEKDFDRFAGPDSQYLFDDDKANAVCEFVSSLRHVQDSITTKAGDLFSPLPWQVWILTNLFGWTYRNNAATRFSRSYVELGRGNGKSFLASGILLFKTFGQNVFGSQAVCTASMMQQSRIVLDTSRKMVSQDPELADSLGLTVTANTILQSHTGSKLWALSAKASSAEGLSINVGCLDELHAARGRSLHDCLASGCTKKVDSLFTCITTAGDDSSGIAYEVHSFVEKVLTGESEDESFFSAMYGIDPGDDWTQPEVWQKANPSWGVSIDPRVMAADCKRAQQIPGSRANFRIKHLSEWIQNGGELPFLDEIAIRKTYDPELDERQFEGTPCTYGCDLASRLDLASCYRIHSRRINGKVHHYVFGRNWLPETQRKANVSYAAWEQRGELVLTDGVVTDQDAIETFLIGELEKYKVREISFDPIQSSMLVSHLQKRGGKTVEVAQSAKFLTPGVLELQESVSAGRFHTNSQILTWCLGNLRVRTIGSSMLQPIRPSDHSLKIDAAVATIMALRSVALVALDDSPRVPRIFSIDCESGAVTDHSINTSGEAAA